MNIENLEKANKIQKRLEFLKQQKGKFEQSERLWSNLGSCFIQKELKILQCMSRIQKQFIYFYFGN